jgi:hypothetical protein
MYDKLYDTGGAMSVLSVRLPKELDTALPRKDRSAWVVEAIRQRLRRDRVRAIAESAAEHADEELEVLEEWVPANAALPDETRRRPRKGKR